MSLEILRIVNAPIDSNCYIVFDKSIGSDCIVVDPGSRDNAVLFEELEKWSLYPKYIVLTHEHYDHCWGVSGLLWKYQDSKVVCSVICSQAIQQPRLNYSHYCCPEEFSLKQADLVLDYNDYNIKWSRYDLIFVPAKGHSASGIFMLLEDALFTGDTLLNNVRTITRYKTGSSLELIKSLAFLDSCKGKKYTVYPGHGEPFLLDGYDLSIAQRG